nr:MAG TPA: putative tail fiber protein [Caudoviricetes sp.]
MANLKEQEKWEDGVYQIEENDPVLGGENGITNKPAKQLANRTLWLKKFLELLGKKSAPKDLTADSTSTADESGHSHKLPVGSITQKGIWQATSDTGIDSDGLVLTAKAGKKLAQSIAQLLLNVTQNYINNNKKSDAVNSSSSEDVASSKAVKTAYDKGVEAKTAADNANQNAEGRVSKSGDTMTGDFLLKQGDYSGLSVYNNNGYYTRLEGNPHNANSLLTLVYRTPQGANIAVVNLPKKNGTIAYADDVVLKSGGDMTGILYSVGISSKHYGYGAYANQYTSGAPFLVNAEGSQDRDTYHPFVKGLVRSKGRFGAGFSFGYTTKQGQGDGFGRGIIHLIEDNGANRLWSFEHNGDFNSAGDVRSSSGKSLNNSVQTSDYRSQWGQTGWVKLPNGLILQWGKTPVIHDENSTDIVFPIAFPNKVLNIQLTENQMRTVHNHATHLAALNVTNSKFTFKINSTLPIDSSADWFAIGY